MVLKKKFITIQILTDFFKSEFGLDQKVLLC